MAAAVGVPAYPVHVGARSWPDHPSRWLWLVKWLLVVPHVLVLIALWVAFVLLSVVALVAILVTGRYPRPVFDFNVGVLRWSWRVSYYSYGALGTDRYPPFSLRPEPDYPAHLEVEYPERLSRGLVLVKWWLLVLPHYAVLVLFLGAGASAAREVADAQWVWDGGLIALLALVAGVALLFTGRYPAGVYDLLLGLNRWALRVAAYAGLMTDAYPPFRLDQGGSEGAVTFAPRPTPGDSAAAAPGTSSAGQAAPSGGRPPTGPATGPGGPPPATPASRWTGGPVSVVVLGALAVLVGLAGVVGGGTLLAGHAFQRADGYVTTPAREVESSGHAVVSGEVVLAGQWLDRGLGEIRLRAAGRDGPVFVGIAAAQDAAAYLSGVEHTVLTGPGPGRDVPGGALTTAPEEAGIWVASASGPGVQTVETEPQPGTWVAVVMPADGSRGVAATADAGATLPWLWPAAVITLAVGAVLVVAGALAMVLAVRAATPAGHGGATSSGPSGTGTSGRG